MRAGRVFTTPLGSESSSPSSLVAATVVLNVNHRAVSNIEHLVQGLPRLWEADRNHDLVRDPFFDVDLNIGRVDTCLTKPGDLAFEDRPGLIRPVSEGRRPAPRASPGHPAPVHLSVKHRDELTRIATQEVSVGIPDAIGVVRFHALILHWDKGHVNGRWPLWGTTPRVERQRRHRKGPTGRRRSP